MSRISLYIHVLNHPRACVCGKLLDVGSVVVMDTAKPGLAVRCKNCAPGKVF